MGPEELEKQQLFLPVLELSQSSQDGFGKRPLLPAGVRGSTQHLLSTHHVAVPGRTHISHALSISSTTFLSAPRLPCHPLPASWDVRLPRVPPHGVSLAGLFLRVGLSPSVLHCRIHCPAGNPQGCTQPRPVPCSSGDAQPPQETHMSMGTLWQPQLSSLPASAPPSPPRWAGQESLLVTPSPPLPHRYILGFSAC